MADTVVLALRRALPGTTVAEGPLPPAGSTVHVALLRTWSYADLVAVQEAALDLDVPTVPVWCDGAVTFVGPLAARGRTGCACCAERWRRATLGPAVPQPPAAVGGTGAIPPAHLDTLAALIRTALTSCGPVATPEGANGPQPRTVAAARSGGAPGGSNPPWEGGIEPQGMSVLYALRGEDGGVSRHSVRPIGGCPQCAPLPVDTAADAVVAVAPRPLPATGELRQDNARTGRAGLRRELADWRLGPVGHLFRSERSALSLVTAEIVNGSHTLREAGYGRAAGYGDSERIALFEAVERYASMRPRARRTSVLASFADLGGARALDPERLGLHDPRYYDDPRFFLVPYAPDVETAWVHGWSFERGAPILVPEHVGYWSSGGRGRFLYESSNGCGMGNSLEEAVLYGLFEVAERDAFLMAWYARTPLVPIAVPVDAPELLHLSDRLDALGYDLRLYDATNDLAIPAVLSLALHRDPASPAPQAFFAAGAHLDPRRALHGAVAEVATNVVNAPVAARYRPEQFDRARLRPMLAEPELVLELDDHVALNTLPEARRRFDWLTEMDADPVPWTERWPGLPVPERDLTAVLLRLLAALRARGLDTVVVDQSEPYTRDRLGLHVVKVIVPGSLPMTFRHVVHRTRGLPRLLDVPHELGRLPAPLAYESLPLHPHPFP